MTPHSGPASPRPAGDAPGQVAAPMTRRERREAERRAARAAAHAAETTPEAAPSEPATDEAPVESDESHAVEVRSDELPHAPGPVADGEIGDISTPSPPGGRNVPVAIGVGLALGLAVVASLFFWRKEAFL